MNKRSCSQSSQSCESCPLPHLETFGLVLVEPVFSFTYCGKWQYYVYKGSWWVMISKEALCCATEREFKQTEFSDSMMAHNGSFGQIWDKRLSQKYN